MAHMGGGRAHLSGARVRGFDHPVRTGSRSRTARPRRSSRRICAEHRFPTGCFSDLWHQTEPACGAACIGHDGAVGRWRRSRLARLRARVPLPRWRRCARSPRLSVPPLISRDPCNQPAPAGCQQDGKDTSDWVMCFAVGDVEVALRERRARRPLAVLKPTAPPGSRSGRPGVLPGDF